VAPRSVLGSLLRNSVNPTLVEAKHFGTGTRDERDGDVAFNWRYIVVGLMLTVVVSHASKTAKGWAASFGVIQTGGAASWRVIFKGCGNPLGMDALAEPAHPSQKQLE